MDKETPSVTLNVETWPTAKCGKLPESRYDIQWAFAYYPDQEKDAWTDEMINIIEAAVIDTMTPASSNAWFFFVTDSGHIKGTRLRWGDENFYIANSPSHMAELVHQHNHGRKTPVNGSTPVVKRAKRGRYQKKTKEVYTQRPLNLP